MEEVIGAHTTARTAVWPWLALAIPTLKECSLAAGSSLLTVLSFPNFDLWFLAWFSLAPLLLVVSQARTTRRAFVLGWLWGVIFFYGTCWWLTYPMIHYAHISAWLALPLFLPPVILVALFVALFCSFLSRVRQRFGQIAIIVAPLIWVSTELLRYAITGQLWNAIGYSQAFHPLLIQSARWGGVYTVGFLILLSNAAVAVGLIRRRLFLAGACTVLLAVILTISAGVLSQTRELRRKTDPDLVVSVIAIQPNVPMDLSGDTAEMNSLLERHFELSKAALNDIGSGKLGTIYAVNQPRLVIWPESPMNFSYSRDSHLRELVGNFARANHTSVLLNSLEPAAKGGDQNSAILVNEQGAIAARYDKIRLMPFGEYVPLPRWLPGASSVRSIVGEFTPGNSYTLMPLGALRAGVFICIEAAHPAIARSFTNEGADVLINISNDGYLGPTPVMRQHLANAIFRAVENDRDLIRVTNTGLTAYVRAGGKISEQTYGFQEAVRTWTISKSGNETTFYTRHGDLFAYGCALITLGIISASLKRRRV